jgi:RNA polymerase sigma-70 factor, ECF subfamily
MANAETAKQTAERQRQLAEARQGNPDALNRLLAASRPYLLLLAQHKLGAALQGRLSPEDVVQETLLEAYRDFPHFRGETDKDLRAWLRRILLHNLFNERRWHVGSAKRSVDCEISLHEIAPLTGTDSPSARLQERESSDELERALRQLPERYRTVLVLHAWEGLTFAEIGVQLCCSAEAARKLWGRGAAKLARLLSDV